MNKNAKKFLRKLTLNTPIAEIKKFCTNEEDTNAIMKRLYDLMNKDVSSVDLTEDLKINFAGEKIPSSPKEIITDKTWQEILKGYYQPQNEAQKSQSLKKILQVLEGIVAIEKPDEEVEISLLIKAQALFSDVPKDKLKTSFIQKTLKIGYGKACKIKDYLLNKN